MALKKLRSKENFPLKMYLQSSARKLSHRKAERISRAQTFLPMYLRMIPRQVSFFPRLDPDEQREVTNNVANVQRRLVCIVVDRHTVTRTQTSCCVSNETGSQQTRLRLLMPQSFGHSGASGSLIIIGSCLYSKKV